MALFSNESKYNRKPVALMQIGNRPKLLSRVLMLIFVLGGLLSNYTALGQPFSGVVLKPISQTNMTTLDASPTSSSSTPLHHFNLSCSGCHKQSLSANTSGSQSALDEIGHVDINSSCTSFGCHDYDRDMNHPVGVAAGITSSNMPLDVNGRMTCLTCHTQEESEILEPVENAINERMLHVSKDGELCGTCHTSAIGGGGNDIHWQFSQKAHLSKIKQTPDNSFDDFSFVSAIDNESQICVGCHDDVTVTVPDLFESKAQKRMRYNKMKDHPIGMEYSAIVSRDAGAYIDSHSISKKVRLFQGRVGCGSCHSLYSDKNSYLIVPHTVSELCRECHVR